MKRVILLIGLASASLVSADCPTAPENCATVDQCHVEIKKLQTQVERQNAWLHFYHTATGLPENIETAPVKPALEGTDGR